MRRLSLILFLAIAMIGCKKNKAITSANTDQKLLVSSTEEFTASGQLSNVTKYWYDANNRLIKEAPPRFQQGYDTIRYSYDNDGNLTAIINYSNGISGSTIFVYKNGVPTLAYDADEPTDTLAKYVVTNNKVTSIIYPGIIYPRENLVNYSIVYTGNNYKSIVELSDPGDSTVSIYTYGTHKSPFYISGYKWFLGNIPSYNLQNQNEIIGANIVSWFPGVTSNTTITYTYNSSGYPVKGTNYAGGSISGYIMYNYIPAK